MSRNERVRMLYRHFRRTGERACVALYHARWTEAFEWATSAEPSDAAEGSES